MKLYLSLLFSFFFLRLEACAPGKPLVPEGTTTASSNPEVTPPSDPATSATEPPTSATDPPANTLSCRSCTLKDPAVNAPDPALLTYTEADPTITTSCAALDITCGAGQNQITIDANTPIDFTNPLTLKCSDAGTTWQLNGADVQAYTCSIKCNEQCLAQGTAPTDDSTPAVVTPFSACDPATGTYTINCDNGRTLMVGTTTGGPYVAGTNVLCDPSGAWKNDNNAFSVFECM